MRRHRRERGLHDCRAGDGRRAPAGHVRPGSCRSGRRCPGSAGASPLETRHEGRAALRRSGLVSPKPRDAFESYQPTSVLAGQDLSLKLAGSLGELLKYRARRHPALARARPVPSRHPRPRRRPRPGPRERPAHRRPLEPVGRPRRGGEPAGGDARRGGARPRHAPLRRQRHRRPRQRRQRHHPDDAGRAGERGGAGRARIGGGGSRRCGGLLDRQRSLRVPGGGSARRSSDVSTPLGDVENSQTRAPSCRGGSYTTARASPAPATSTTTRSTAYRSSRAAGSS